ASAGSGHVYHNLYSFFTTHRRRKRWRTPAATSPASFVRSPMSPSTSSARIFNRSPSASTFFTSSVCGNGWSTLRKGRSTLAPFASRVAGPATLAGSIFSQWEMRTIV
ncbi:hypothetical protein GYH30_017588, partial [Glycine max]